MRALVLAMAVASSGCLNWEALSQMSDGGADSGTFAMPFEGFGAITTGGDSQPLFHVTTLADTGMGTGSLRDALSASNRHIVFDVSGTISLSSEITLDGLSNLTIDGAGITLIGAGLFFENGTHDVIVRGLRVRNSRDDGMHVLDSSRIVFDHVSVANPVKGAIDVTGDSRDVTIQWCVLQRPPTSMALATTVVSFGARRVSVHHNLYVGEEGNPQLAGAPTNGEFPTADVRNNLLWNWGGNGRDGFGVGVDDGAGANVVGNFMQTAGIGPENAVTLNRGPGANAFFFARDNVSGNSQTVLGGNVGEYSAPAITEDTACGAARKVLSAAGARPLDSTDQQLLGGIALSGCP
ncbi:MAG: hypothetical protein QM817_39960 [Archangium sp.]